MTKTLFLESVAGIAGDMFAASVLDAGLVSIEELQSLPSLLNLAGVEIEAGSAIRATMKAARIVVKWNDEAWKDAFGKNHAPNNEHSHSHGDAHGQEHSHHHRDQSTNLLLGEDAHSHWH